MGEEVVVKAQYGQTVKRISLDITAFNSLPALHGYLTQLFKASTSSKLRYKDSEGDWIDMFEEQDLKLALKTRTDNALHVRLDEPLSKTPSTLLNEHWIGKVKEMKKMCEDIIENYEKLKSNNEKENVVSNTNNKTASSNNLACFLEQQMIPPNGFAYDTQAAAYFHQFQQPPGAGMMPPGMPGMMYYPPPTMLASPMIHQTHSISPTSSNSYKQQQQQQQQ